ncbi:MAG: hypothetical protein IT372_19235 [Polyangiaceae bacterium]|nr:hypothetical protein [Polyangiaceae bacterium]
MWLGGGSGIVTTVERDSSGVGAHAFGAYGQTELDFRAESGNLYFRLDLDLQFASSYPAKVAAGFTPYPPVFEFEPGVKLGPPEWAMVQLTVDPFKVRAGIVTHSMGFEDWDQWNTYFPTKSTGFNLAAGRMAGIEPVFSLDSGYDIFAFAGCDLDWGGCFEHDTDGDGEIVPGEIKAGDGLVAGAGVATLQESFGTWSGIALFPTLDYYIANLAFEFYPHDAFTVAVDGVTGLYDPREFGEQVEESNFFLTGTLTVNVLPAEIVHPMFRFQGLIDPDDKAWGGFYPKVSGSAGLSTTPIEGFKITVEGKASRYNVFQADGSVDSQVVPGFYAGISFVRPEPPPYTARYPEAEPEPAAEPAAPEGAPAAPEPAAP